jgi:hypothetical protein
MIDSATDHRSEVAAAPARGPIEHKVKSWTQFFEATLSGAKTHEVRRLTDRDYRVGDRLLLQEYEPNTETYSGRELVVRITYMTSADAPCALSEECLHPDYCIFSIVKV